jgi:hypothetical protein
MMKKLRIFAASPSDMAAERAKVETVAAMLEPLADNRGQSRTSGQPAPRRYAERCLDEGVPPDAEFTPGRPRAGRPAHDAGPGVRIHTGALRQTFRVHGQVTWEEVRPRQRIPSGPLSVSGGRRGWASPIFSRSWRFCLSKRMGRRSLSSTSRRRRISASESSFFKFTW